MSDMPNYIKPKIRRSIDLPFLLERKESSKPKDHDAVKKMVKNFAQFDFPILRRRMSVNSLKIALVREVLQISPFYCPL